ncbi:hypothetical protein DV737_g1399, partial [Chaetothyriales sp. CBS 132003]
MSNHTTRQASLADVQQIAQVFAAGFIDDDVFGQAGEGAASASSEAGDGRESDDANWADRSADPEAIAAFDRNWEDIKHHFCGPRAESWMIELFCVAPDAQKSGHGRQLIHAAIALCQAESPMVPLCVIASETGDAFYEKLGFRQVGRANVGGLSGVRGGSLKFYEEHLDRGDNEE